MGLSSNQARFLSLTSRQIDMEQRIQQICQRRLRLSSELENIATSYNNQISNRKMFLASQTSQGIQALTVQNLSALGYKVLDSNKNKILKGQQTTAPSGYTAINTQQDFMNVVNLLNTGNATALSGKYMLNCDIDLSGTTYTQSVINQTFQGVFDGNGHTISNMKIDTGGAATNNVGLFSKLSGANVENLIIEDANVNAANSQFVGALAGYAIDGTTISNAYVSATVNGADDRVGGVVGGADWTGDVLSNITADVNVTGSGDRVGGLTGSIFGGTLIQNCEVSGNVTSTKASPWGVGGIVGDSNVSTIKSCSASVNVTAAKEAGGIAGLNCGSTILNSYSTGSVICSDHAGGIAGYNWSGATIADTYTTAIVSTGGNYQGGFAGESDASATNSFYDNNYTGTNYGAVDIGSGGSSPVGSWDNTVWDKSTTLPTLKDVGYIPFAEDLEQGLRNGTYTLLKDADEYTQDVIDINNGQYQAADWRSTPEIYDELYKGDDAAAEDKYDKIVSEINAQDKKLQLEQTSVEVEYKAVTSERESVKKILDTNAQSSFKYFS